MEETTPISEMNVISAGPDGLAVEPVKSEVADEVTDLAEVVHEEAPAEAEPVEPEAPPEPKPEAPVVLVKVQLEVELSEWESKFQSRVQQLVDDVKASPSELSKAWAKSSNERLGIDLVD